MKNQRHPVRTLLASGAILAALLQTGCESTPKPVDENRIADQVHIPDAKANAVWIRSLEATMGETINQDVQSMRLTGSMSMPAQGINASMNILIVPNTGMHMVMEIPGLGAFEQGVTGDIAWSNDMMSGPKIFDEDEAKQYIKQIDIYADLHWDQYYQSITYKGEETIAMPDDTEVMTSVLELISIDDDEGTPSTQYYDVETGLLVKATTIAVIAGGAKAPTTAYTMDYRDIGGILMPFKTISSVGPMQNIIEFTSVEVNVEVGDNELDLPEDIQELIEE